jgi:hypothetical protein
MSSDRLPRTESEFRKTVETRTPQILPFISVLIAANLY